MKYIADGGISHNGTEYSHGSEIELTDNEAAPLRKVGAIKLPSELLAPETISAQLEAKDMQIATLGDQVADLDAQLAQLEADKNAEIEALKAQLAAQKPAKTKDAPPATGNEGK